MLHPAVRRHNVFWRRMPAGLIFLAATGLSLKAAGYQRVNPPVSASSAAASSGHTGTVPQAASRQPAPTSPADSPQSSPAQAKKHIATGAAKHIFFVIPAYNVDYGHHFTPLSAHEKFLEWAQGAYDPMGLAGSATEAALEHSRKSGFCGYGSEIGGYGKCYGSALLDSNISSFFGDYLFPAWLHQDPRYFRLGRQASFGARIWYAFSRVFICRTDNGGWTFASGALGGTAIAAAASNLYYPQSDVGLQHTFSRVYWDMGGTAIFNLEAEFWPDIRHGIGSLFH